MAREIVGHTLCPECGGKAQVRRQGNGRLYRYCPEDGNWFAPTDEASERLRVRMTPAATATGQDEKTAPAEGMAEPPAATSSSQAPAVKPVVTRTKATGGMGLFGRGAA